MLDEAMALACGPADHVETAGKSVCYSSGASSTTASDGSSPWIHRSCSGALRPTATSSRGFGLDTAEEVRFALDPGKQFVLHAKAANSKRACERGTVGRWR